MEFIALIVAVAAMVWGAALLRQGGLMAGCLLVLISGICFGPPFFSLAGGPMPLTADRALLGLLVVMYAGYRYFGWTECNPLTATDGAVAALIGILVLNTFTHDWKLNRSQPLSYLVFFWLMPVAIYWVARQMKITERGMRWLLGTFAVLGVYLAVTAVAEAKYQWGFVFPRYIVSLEHKEFLGRGRGPLLNPAGNGILMVLCLGCGLMAWPRFSRMGRLLLATGFVPLMLLGVYCTLTRSAWMGAGLGLLVVTALCLPRHLRMPAIAMTLILGTVTVAANWEHLLAFKRDKELTAAEAADSATLRPILAYVAWQMFWDRPIMGCGLAHYLDEKNPYLADRGIDLPLPKVRPYVQHNAVLSLLVETGLLGAGAFVVLIALWLREAWRLWRTSEKPLWQRQGGLVFLTAMAGYFPNAMFQDPTIIPMMNMLLFFFGGVTLNLAQSPAEPEAVPELEVIEEDHDPVVELANAEAVERDWFGQPAPVEVV